MKPEHYKHQRPSPAGCDTPEPRGVAARGYRRPHDDSCVQASALEPKTGHPPSVLIVSEGLPGSALAGPDVLSRWWRSLNRR